MKQSSTKPDESWLRGVVASGERLDVEFKSDRQRLSDADIVEAVVCLANLPPIYDRGVLLIGVEDDGQITGAKPRHGSRTDADRLQAMIFGRTEPAIETQVAVVTCPVGDVIAVVVPRGESVNADKTGRSVRRVTGIHGPQCVPFYPHEHGSYRSDLGLNDVSAQPLTDLDRDVLDPLEFHRVRQTIARLGGDRALGDLDDDALAKALNVVQTHAGRLVPNVAGLLLLGREDVLGRVLPNHEIGFHVFDLAGNVLINDSLRGPLLRTLEETTLRFAARNAEQEVMAGPYRVPIPDIAPDAFREAINNAVLHRDYSRHQPVFVQWFPDRMVITSPGGFPRGITLDNLLVHEPTPRNPLLADVFKRCGLVERTGRGIDRIFYGLLRYGRPAPDYGQSDHDSVRVSLSSERASGEFVRFVFDQQGGERTFDLDALIVLDQLRRERRTNAAIAARAMQKGEAVAREVLERLVEWGIAEAKGERRGRVYHLSAAVYRALGEAAGYVRTRGFERIHQEAMVMEFVHAHGSVRRADVIELCALEPREASRLLRSMTESRVLRQQGTRRAAYYVRSPGAEG